MKPRIPLVRILLLIFITGGILLTAGTALFLYRIEPHRPFRIDGHTSLQIIRLAKDRLGVPYRRGGTTPQGFDCSGFVRYVYRLAGYPLPRTTGQMYRQLRPVSDPRPGELLFFDTEGRGITHVAIWLGNGRFIHAPRPGRTVSIELLSNNYWLPRYRGARSVKP